MSACMHIAVGGQATEGRTQVVIRKMDRYRKNLSPPLKLVLLIPDYHPACPSVGLAAGRRFTLWHTSCGPLVPSPPPSLRHLGDTSTC